jgi:3-methylcrotonyl-CoA carboxylase alpha subunit
LFEKILIANRGEIACRIIRTARRLGIRTVAVHSEADAQAPHVAMADEAVLLGPAPARESYLRIDRIVEAARRTGAEAVHPGYGFLAENADFAEACAAAGLIFVGPPASAIRAMGSKQEAKALMEQAGVPIVPGYHGADQDEGTLLRAAKEIGFPVLIKASAGGGGKGMRRVDRASTFAAELAAAKREALSAFGDDRVLIEKFVARPRHIEVQIFADSQGNVVHLFERDCSVQRRYQKVVEEAPAFGLTPEQRREIGATAIAAARAVGYVGAGTVEFIAGESGSVYFMEMNTRLQVEHPVTEMVTGQDLVEWQLRVAAGEVLPLTQDRIVLAGHAIEARLYAEDPARGFLPSVGRLVHFHLPPESFNLRTDSGVRQGDEVSIHYDAMLAKVVVWDENRPAAVRRLRKALSSCEIIGVASNLDWLAALTRHPRFKEGAVDTGFIERHETEIAARPAPPIDIVLALASLHVLLRREEDAKARALRAADSWSPWHSATGWRLNGDARSVLRFRRGDMEFEIAAIAQPDGIRLTLPKGSITVRGALEEEGKLRADLDGRWLTPTIVRQANLLTVLLDGASDRLELLDPLALTAVAEAPSGRLTAPMPGRIVEVLAKPGETVKRGAALIVLEAMKMEHTIGAPSDGAVAELYYSVGDLVEEGMTLLSFTVAEAGE